jgi:hypothetical protein
MPRDQGRNKFLLNSTYRLPGISECTSPPLILIPNAQETKIYFALVNSITYGVKYATAGGLYVNKKYNPDEIGISSLCSGKTLAPPPVRGEGTI